MQVLLAQWMPAKALEQVMAAVKTFYQASQTVLASSPQLDANVQQPGPAMKPHLWLQCRLQVGCLLACALSLLHGYFGVICSCVLHRNGHGAAATSAVYWMCSCADGVDCLHVLGCSHVAGQTVAHRPLPMAERWKCMSALLMSSSQR